MVKVASQTPASMSKAPKPTSHHVADWCCRMANFLYMDAGNWRRLFGRPGGSKGNEKTRLSPRMTMTLRPVGVMRAGKARIPLPGLPNPHKLPNRNLPQEREGGGRFRVRKNGRAVAGIEKAGYVSLCCGAIHSIDRGSGWAVLV